MAARLVPAQSTNLGNVMPIGDSITVGEYSGGFLPGGWRDPLYQDLTGAGYSFTYVGSQTENSDPTLDAAGESHHEGHSGYTIANIPGTPTTPGYNGIDDNLASYFSQLSGQPNYILLMIGTNDVETGNATGDVQRLATLIDHLSNPVTGFAPDARLIVTTILPNRESDANEANVVAYNAGLLQDVISAELAGENVGYVNIGPQINEATDLADNIHPNAAGEQIIASGWTGAIESGATVAATQWSGPSVGTWEAATNWSTGVPETPGVTATFAGGILGNGSSATISLNSNVSLGHMIFNNSSGFNISSGTGGTLTFDDSGPVATGVADLTVLAGSQIIGVPVALANGLTINVASNSTLTVNGGITGTGGLIYNGPGTLVLFGPGTYAGPTLVNSGLILIGPGGQFPATSALNVSAGRIVNAATSSAQPYLSLAFGGTTGHWTGIYDVNTGGLDLSSASLATITSYVAEGYNLTGGGNWAGPGGIDSSSAASDSTHLHAVGVILNNVAGSPIYSQSNPFIGVNPGLNDVLVRYTYFGDANLDGKVDGSDYSLIDNGYLNHLSGWYNGDFNYDGVIDGSDYALIDNAFNNQASTNVATLEATTEIAGPLSAVPEPSAVAVALLPAAMAFYRKRRLSR